MKRVTETSDAQDATTPTAEEAVTPERIWISPTAFLARSAHAVIYDEAGREPTDLEYILRSSADAETQRLRWTLLGAKEYLDSLLGDCDPDCDCIIHIIDAALQTGGESPTQPVVACPHLHQDYPGTVLNKCLDCGEPVAPDVPLEYYDATLSELDPTSWKPVAQPEAVGEATGCFDCQRPYGDEYGFPDLLIPDWAWDFIAPKDEGGGLLCPSCICKRLHNAKIECEGSWRSGPLFDLDKEELRNLAGSLSQALAGKTRPFSEVRSRASELIRFDQAAAGPEFGTLSATSSPPVDAEPLGDAELREAQRLYEQTSADDIGHNYLRWAQAAFPLWPKLVAHAGVSEAEKEKPK